MRIFLSTGEVSGDVVGARVAAEILRLAPEAKIAGVGGARMAAAGVAIDCATNQLGTVGISEALVSLPAFVRVFAGIRRRVKREPPDVALLVGNDVFHVLLGRWLKARGIPTVSYFPPQPWIWRSLARPISRSFDLVLASFPEEGRVYGATGVPTRFVGHYLSEGLRPATAAQSRAARLKLGVRGSGPVIGILPGSRDLEIRRLAPVLLDAAAGILRERPDSRFLLPLSEPLYEERLLRQIEARGLRERVTIARGGPESLPACDVALVVSGTASLEAALLGVPMVIVYRVSPFTIGIVRSAIRLGLMDSETLGLPNLILGRPVVPEIVQERLEPAAVEREALALLNDPEAARAMRAALGEVAARIHGGDSVRNVAEAVLRAAPRRDQTPAVRAAVATTSAHHGEA